MTEPGRVSSAASAQYGWPCPRCAVAPYAPCRAVSGRVTDTHAARLIPPATGSAPRTRGVVTEPGRVLPPDWCLTCRSYVTQLNEHATHDVIYEPPAGWQCCDCHHCRRVVEQMTAPARECAQSWGGRTCRLPAGHDGMHANARSGQ